MNTKDKINFYFNVLTRLDANIATADAKSNSSLTYLFAILTFLVGIVGSYIGSLEKLSIECLNGMDAFIIIVVIIDIFLFVMWYSACIEVINPNLQTTENENDNYQSVIFFKSIRSLEMQDFISYTRELNEQEQLSDLLKQIHIVSVIVDKKYENFIKIHKWVVMTTFVFLFILLLILSQL